MSMTCSIAAQSECTALYSLGSGSSGASENLSADVSTASSCIRNAHLCSAVSTCQDPSEHSEYANGHKETILALWEC